MGRLVKTTYPPIRASPRLAGAPRSAGRSRHPTLSIRHSHKRPGEICGLGEDTTTPSWLSEYRHYPLLGVRSGSCRVMSRHVALDKCWTSWTTRLLVSNRPRVVVKSRASSRGGEIGRHAGFRCQWGQPRGGSSPLLGTTSCFVPFPSQCAATAASGGEPRSWLAPWTQAAPQFTLVVVH